MVSCKFFTWKLWKKLDWYLYKDIRIKHVNESLYCIYLHTIDYLYKVSIFVLELNRFLKILNWVWLSICLSMSSNLLFCLSVHPTNNFKTNSVRILVFFIETCLVDLSSSLHVKFKSQSLQFLQFDWLNICYRYQVICYKGSF